MDAQRSHVVHIALLVVEEAHALEWHTSLLVQRTQMTLLRTAVDFTALFGDNIHHRKPRFDDEFLQTLAPPCGLIAAAGHTDKDLAPLLPFVAVSPA